MDSDLFWSLFAAWALLCLFLERITSTPIFRSQDVRQADDGCIEYTNPTA